MFAEIPKSLITILNSNIYHNIASIIRISFKIIFEII